jgi:hypothetical protein
MTFIEQAKHTAIDAAYYTTRILVHCDRERHHLVTTAMIAGEISDLLEKIKYTWLTDELCKTLLSHNKKMQFIAKSVAMNHLQFFLDICEFGRGIMNFIKNTDQIEMLRNMFHQKLDISPRPEQILLPLAIKKKFKKSRPYHQKSQKSKKRARLSLHIKHNCGY